MAAGFRRMDQQSQAGRKIIPTGKVKQLMSESVRTAFELYLVDFNDREHATRVSMHANLPTTRLNEDRALCVTSLEKLRGTHADLAPLLDEEDLAYYNAQLRIAVTAFDRLEEDLCKQQQRDINSSPAAKLKFLKDQSARLEKEIQKMESQLNTSSRAGVVNSTPRPPATPSAPPFPPAPASSFMPKGRLAPSTIHVAPPLVSPAPAGDASMLLLAKLAELLENKGGRQSLPRVEPEVFKGDLLEFPAWWSSFHTMIESRARSSKDRLFYLQKYTASKAKDCIQGFISLYDDESAYDKAKSVLFSRFGNKIKIAEAYKDKLNRWPKVKDGDAEALTKYSDFLWQCLGSMESLQYLSNLDSHEENVRMASKLPGSLIERWDRYLDRTMYGGDNDLTQSPLELTGRVPSFREFCCFVGDEARVMTNSSATRGSDKKKAAVMATSTKPTSGKAEYKPYCTYCKQEHRLWECDKFLGQTADTKKAYAKEKRLCFGCLRRSHLYRDCRTKNNKLLAEPATAAVTLKTHLGEGESMYGSMILPVWIFLGENEHHRFLTYALIDSQSDGCFVSSELVELLQAEGRSVSLDLTTMGATHSVDSKAISGLEIKGQCERERISLPVCYTREQIPGDKAAIPDPAAVADWDHLNSILPYIEGPQDNIEIGLLLGTNCEDAFYPIDLRVGGKGKPFGYKTTLGWSVLGKIRDGPTPVVASQSLRTSVKELTRDDVMAAFDVDFEHKSLGEEKMSADDLLFNAITSAGIRQEDDGHFEIPLPMKTPPEGLPDSRPFAARCLESMGRKMTRNPEFGDKYSAFMNKLVDTGQAELVAMPDLTPTNKRWYWSHHGVVHPRKPGSIRGVFNGSQPIRGVALNDLLLQGPDKINSLVGILCRFRQEKVGVTCDVEGMFLQVRVTEECRDYLRFLWYEDGDPQKPVQEYRMRVHLFGATSSPGCAALALNTTADRYEQKCGSDAARFIRDDFYVDDGLGSVPDDDQAVALMKSSHELCALGGFNLRKFMCTSSDALERIPRPLRATSLQNITLSRDNLPTERSLGVEVSLSDDAFVYNVAMLQKPDSRRGYLSALSSVYDPMGLVSPVLLEGRLILQSLCQEKIDWDAPLEPEVREAWGRWYRRLGDLSNLKVPRCIRATASLPLTRTELHVFCDASSHGYGVCAYMLLQDAEGTTDTALIYAKSRVAPSKATTIPRLELQSAVLAVKSGHFLNKELRYDDLRVHYWTDSMVTLGYISNESRKFQIYVANRSQYIRSRSQLSQWHHVSSEDNPADIASRGASPTELISNALWWSGPDVIRQEERQPLPELIMEPQDPEVKKTRALASKVSRIKPTSVWARAAGRVSTWRRLVSVGVACLRFGQSVMRRALPARPASTPVQDRIRVEMALLRECQLEAFNEEIAIVSASQLGPADRDGACEKKSVLKAVSSLYRLEPFLDDHSLLRVGGRVQASSLQQELVHPIILPRRSPITGLIVHHFHNQSQHMGISLTLNSVRQAGYWPINGRSTVTHYVGSCTICRRYRGAMAEQKMAPLPAERVQEVPPFTYVAMDLFGPFLLKRQRSQVKRWICIFICFNSKAHHVEVCHSLDTSSFFNAYRRFVSRRGPVRALYCDRGTNFIGAHNETTAALAEMITDDVTEKMAKEGCDVVDYRFNFPQASHMGGLWERQIRTFRQAMTHAVSSHGAAVDEETFYTVVAEAEAIVNGRPLSVISGDVNDPLPITPATLLTQKTRQLLPLPGIFTDADRYSRRRWRVAQLLVQQFWQRWRKDVLPDMQGRSKWQRERKNLQVGDIVLMSEPTTGRNQWPLARVEQTHPSADGRVRKVTVRARNSTYQRPIQKLVLLFRPESDSHEEPEQAVG